MYFARFHFSNGTHLDLERRECRWEAARDMRESIWASPLGEDERAVIVHVRTIPAEQRRREKAVIEAATTYRNAVQANLVPTELGNGLVVDTFARLAAAVASLES